MLGQEDYAEACRRYKDRRTKLPERQRYHALILVTQGYHYREVGRILLVDEEPVSGWVTLYQAHGLDGVKNHPGWGGEHQQRFLKAEQLAELKQRLEAESDAGHEVRERVDSQSNQETGAGAVRGELQHKRRAETAV